MKVRGRSGRIRIDDAATDPSPAALESIGMIPYSGRIVGIPDDSFGVEDLSETLTFAPDQAALIDAYARGVIDFAEVQSIEGRVIVIDRSYEQRYKEDW